MRFLIIIFVGVLPEFILGQYTYFNIGLLPVGGSNAGSALISNLLISADTLIATGAYPNGGSTVFSFRKIDYNGQLLEEVSNEISGFYLTNYGDALDVKEDKYLYAGSTGNSEYPFLHPVISRFNSQYELNWNLAMPELSTDSIEAEFHFARYLQDGSYLAIGIRTYDTIPSTLGNNFSKIFISKYTSDNLLLWTSEIEQDTMLNFDGDLSFLRVCDLYELSNGDLILFGAYYRKYQPFAVRLDSGGHYISHVSWGNLLEDDWLPWVVPIDTDEFILVYQHAVGVSGIGEDFVNHKPRIGYFHADSMTITDWHMYEHQHYWGNITDFEKTPDGGYVVLGFGSDDSGEFMGEAYMMKIDADFNELWYQTYQPPIDYNSPDATDLEITTDGGLAFVGNFAVQGQTYYKSWVVKTDPCGDLVYNGCPVGVNELNNLNSGFSFYPNPAQKSILISSDKKFDQVVIREVTGRILLSENIQGPTKEMNLDISGLASGLYMLELHTDSGEVMAQRLVVE